MSLYTENTSEQSCQVGCGVSNIGSLLQPALDRFREGLLEISGTVIRQIKSQRGAGVKRKSKNKKKKQKGSGLIKKKKSGKRGQTGGGKPRITEKKTRIPTKNRLPVRKPNF